MSNRPYLKHWIVISIVTILLSTASYVIDYLIGHSKYELFARSGALIVLSGAALEYQLSIGNYLSNVLKNNEFITMQEQDNALVVTDKSSTLQKYAHALVLLGTVIWAYGDFLVVKI